MIVGKVLLAQLQSPLSRYRRPGQISADVNTLILIWEREIERLISFYFKCWAIFLAQAVIFLRFQLTWLQFTNLKNKKNTIPVIYQASCVIGPDICRYKHSGSYLRTKVQRLCFLFFVFFYLNIRADLFARVELFLRPQQTWRTKIIPLPYQANDIKTVWQG